MAALENGKIREKPKVEPLTVPKPLLLGGSPCSSPYFQKLPPLSPRSLKGIDPNYSISPDFRRRSPADFTTRDSSASITCSSVDSECISITESAESNTDDIDFFLQVVGVFREYVTDQIHLLEVQYAENQVKQECLQKELRKAEDEASHQENQIVRDVAHLVSLLHQKQAELKEKLKKQNAETANEIREKADRCRRNAKLISGILSFAKRLRNESGESLRENAVRELKQRLSCISDMSTPILLRQNDYPTRIDVETIASFIEGMHLISPTSEVVPHVNGISGNSPPIVSASQFDDDVTKSSITVRWHCACACKGSHDVKWFFTRKGDLVESEQVDVTSCAYVIRDLPPCCNVTVQVRHPITTREWSSPARFRTRSPPARFSFDANTAHMKLKLSPDSNTVFYRGDDQSSGPKSPSRFTFALNVLSNISFYTGRHYWEMKVNRDGWAAGVAYQGVPRNSWLGSNESSWILHHNPAKFEYKVRHAGESCEVTLDLPTPRHYLQKVGIYLDFEAGIIRFVDPTKEQVLYTYMEDRFAEPLCAAANPFYHGGCITVISGLDIPEFLKVN